MEEINEVALKVLELGVLSMQSTYNLSEKEACFMSAGLMHSLGKEGDEGREETIEILIGVGKGKYTFAKLCETLKEIEEERPKKSKFQQRLDEAISKQSKK